MIIADDGAMVVDETSLAGLIHDDDDADDDASLLLLAWFLFACDPRNGSTCSA